MPRADWLGGLVRWMEPHESVRGSLRRVISRATELSMVLAILMVVAGYGAYVLEADGLMPMRQQYLVSALLLGVVVLMTRSSVYRIGLLALVGWLVWFPITLMVTLQWEVVPTGIVAFALVIGLVGLWLTARLVLLVMGLDIAALACLLIVGQLSLLATGAGIGAVMVIGTLVVVAVERREAVTLHLESELERLREAQRAQHMRGQNTPLMQLKNEVLGNMSHELRTPLTVILGFVNMLLDGTLGTSLDDPAREAVQRVDLSSRRLLDVVDDLLDLSELDGGMLRVDCRRVNISDLAADVYQIWQHQGVNRHLHFKVLIGHGLPDSVLVDREVWRQVMEHLLSNAAKFTSKGSVLVRLDRYGTDQWMTQVSDSGIGIPTEARDWIFQPFRQGDSSIKRSYNGLGLGLALAQGLTEAMGGTISVESIPGAGSTFKVALPLSMESDHIPLPQIGNCELAEAT